jgi:hypothetical protein
MGKKSVRHCPSAMPPLAGLISTQPVWVEFKIILIPYHGPPVVLAGRSGHSK